MVKNCKICKEKIDEDNGKLKGTVVKVMNEENNKNEHVYVCKDCQKLPDWLEQAKK